jgi:hypothetical protein
MTASGPGSAHDDIGGREAAARTGTNLEIRQVFGGEITAWHLS